MCDIKPYDISAETPCFARKPLSSPLLLTALKSMFFDFDKMLNFSPCFSRSSSPRTSVKATSTTSITCSKLPPCAPPPPSAGAPLVDANATAVFCSRGPGACTATAPPLRDSHWGRSPRPTIRGRGFIMRIFPLAAPLRPPCSCIPPPPALLKACAATVGFRTTHPVDLHALPCLARPHLTASGRTKKHSISGTISLLFHCGNQSRSLTVPTCCFVFVLQVPSRQGLASNEHHVEAWLREGTLECPVGQIQMATRSTTSSSRTMHRKEKTRRYV